MFILVVPVFLLPFHEKNVSYETQNIILDLSY